MQEVDIDFLTQLVQSLEDAELKLEQSYKNNDSIKFNEIKKFMLKIQKQIYEMVK